MTSNWLKISANKTQMIWIGKRQQLDGLMSSKLSDLIVGHLSMVKAAFSSCGS